MVLGGGGSVAGPWAAGLVDGLRRDGTDLGAADLIVGTAAGAYIGACLAADADVSGLILDLIKEHHVDPAPDIDQGLLYRTIEILSDTSVPARTRRRMLGDMARDTGYPSMTPWLDRVMERLPVADWPDRELLLTSVAADTGERTVWRRGGAATLHEAVRASCSWPVLYVPTAIDGRPYIDGGVHSSTSADLARGHDRVIVLAPLRHMLPRAELDAELADLGTARVTVLCPDREAAELFTLGLFEPNLRYSAYDAGLRQAAEFRDEVAALWTA
nr:patatin-like phospholipase family protein [Actinomadura rayongensis]